MLVKESPWAAQVVEVEYLGLCAPGCTEPLLRCQISSKQHGTHAIDISLSEAALSDLGLALELFEEQRALHEQKPRQ